MFTNEIFVLSSLDATRTYKINMDIGRTLLTKIDLDDEKMFNTFVYIQQ